MIHLDPKTVASQFFYHPTIEITSLCGAKRVDNDWNHNVKAVTCGACLVALDALLEDGRFHVDGAGLLEKTVKRKTLLPDPP